MIDLKLGLMDGVGVDGAGTPAGDVVKNGGGAVVAGSLERAVVNAAAVSTPSGVTPNPEVREITKKRTRTLEEKFRIVREFADCASTGEKGALLRREGIYASYIHRWRLDLDERTLLGLSNHKRGPKEDPARKEKLHIIELDKKVLGLEKDLKKCHIIIDFQKKLSEILGIALPPVEMPS